MLAGVRESRALSVSSVVRALACAAGPPTHPMHPLPRPASARAEVTNAGEGALSYRTRCSHLFCDACARAYFARGHVVCPVCDGDVSGEAGILRLSHAHGLEALAAAFAFAASFPEDALAVAAEGIRFRLEQTALAGTREIYVRAKQAEAAEASAAAAAGLRAQLDEARRDLAGAHDKLRDAHAQLAEARRLYVEQQQRGMPRPVGAWLRQKQQVHQVEM